MKNTITFLLITFAFILVGCQAMEKMEPTNTVVVSTATREVSPTDTPDPTQTQALPTETPVEEQETFLYIVDKYDPKRDAAQDLNEALTLAKSADKKVILEVGGDWCPDCINLEKFIQNNEDIYAEMANQYFIVKINLSQENVNKEFLSQYPEFEWVPYFFILDSDGSLLKPLDTRELMEDGIFDAENFWNFLNSPLTMLQNSGS